MHHKAVLERTIVSQEKTEQNFKMNNFLRSDIDCLTSFQYAPLKNINMKKVVVNNRGNIRSSHSMARCTIQMINLEQKKLTKQFQQKLQQSERIIEQRDKELENITHNRNNAVILTARLYSKQREIERGSDNSIVKSHAKEREVERGGKYTMNTVRRNGEGFKTTIKGAKCRCVQQRKLDCKKKHSKKIVDFSNVVSKQENDVRIEEWLETCKLETFNSQRQRRITSHPKFECEDCMKKAEKYQPSQSPEFINQFKQKKNSYTKAPTERCQSKSAEKCQSKSPEKGQSKCSEEYLKCSGNHQQHSSESRNSGSTTQRTRNQKLHGNGRSKSRESIQSAKQDLDVKWREISASHKDIKDCWRQNTNAVFSNDYMKDMEENMTEVQYLRRKLTGVV